MEEPVVISSYLVVFEDEHREEALAKLGAMPGVEVHGSEGGQYVVSIEAPSIDETYDLAVEITKMPGVITFNLVFCNFEDEAPRT